MANEDVRLLSWDRFGRVCHLNVATGRKQWVKGSTSTSTSGTIKSFMFGRFLAVYRQENTWYIQRGNQRQQLNSNLALKVKSFFPFMVTSLTLEGKRHTLWDFSPLVFIAKKFDPTYDAMDGLGDSYYDWLISVRNKGN